MSLEERERAEFWERRADHLDMELAAVRRTIAPLEEQANRDHARANALHDLALTTAERIAKDTFRPTALAKELQLSADRLMGYKT